jgi:hypothetical protein
VNAALDVIRQAVRDRYRTAHALCRANPGLTRSTVYLVLSGRYPGNVTRQIGKIENALAGGAALPEPRRIIDAQEAYSVLQEAKCAYCRKLDKRACPECNTQTAREAQALEEYLGGRRQ